MSTTVIRPINAMKNRTLTVLASLFVAAITATGSIIPAPDDQEEPSVAASGNGYFVVWADKRNYAANEYDIYGSRVSITGEILDPNGIPICTDPGRQTSPRVAFNGNEFLVVWEDDRESTTNFLLYQIYGARVTTDGRVMDTNGFKITTNQITRTGPAVTSDGKGFFAVWVDWHRSSNSIADIFGSPISADGVVANPDGIPLVQAPLWQTDPRIAFANGEYLVTYIDDPQIRGLRVATNGTPLSASFAISSDSAFDRHGLASNGRDYFEVWGDSRNSPSGVGYSDIYGTLISSNGLVLNPGGIPISTNGYYAERPKIASDGYDFMAIWEESNDPTNGITDLYGARLTGSGSVGTPSRIIVNRSPGVQINPDIASGGLAVWQDGRSLPNESFPLGGYDVYGALIIDDTTFPNTNGFLISSIQSTNHPPVAFSQSLISTQGTSLFIALNADDADNDPLSFRIVSPPTLGYLTGAPPNVLYISTTNFLTTVTDSFTFVANDGFVDSPPATISITLYAQNSNTNPLPVISLIANDAVASEALNPDGTTNTATFSIQRTGNTTNSVSVSLSVHGSAIYGTDYYTIPTILEFFTNSQATITMDSGTTSRTFTLYPVPDNLTEGTEFATFTIESNSSYTIGQPGQTTISILDSNNVPGAVTRIIFPAVGSVFASPRNIEIRVANTNVSKLSVFGDGNLLASATGTPSGNFVFNLITNFPTGSHIVYSVANNSITSAPIRFIVLGTNATLTPSLGVMPTANASFLVDANGALFDWGDDRYANLGDGGQTNVGPTGVTLPIQIPLPSDHVLGGPFQGPARWAKVVSGARHTLALTTEGGLYATGDNSFGQTNNRTNISTFTQIQPLLSTVRWTDIAAGGLYTLALRSDGELFAWGYNASGELGTGNTITTNSPQIVRRPADVARWTAIAAGTNHSLALGSDGNIYAWGRGDDGKLGDGAFTNSSRPVLVVKPTGVTNWTKICAGDFHSLALAGNGQLYAWGIGASGQLGNGGNANSAIPVPVTAPSGVAGWRDMAAGVTHSLAIADNGDLYAWGAGVYGQLGPNSGGLSQRSPVLVPLPNGVGSWTDVSAGAFHSLALGDNCTLYSWGANNFGQLGIGSFINQTNEIPVQNLSGGVCASFTNQPPFAFSQFLVSTQRSVVPITLTGSDVNNDPLTFRILTPPTLGFLTGAPPNVLYLSTTNFLTTVTDAFTFVANDGYTDSLPATVTLLLYPITQSSNTLPIVTVTTSDAQASEFLNFDGTTNTANFTIRRTSPTNTALNVVLTATGTANYGVDYYTAPPLNVSSNARMTIVPIPAGAASMPFTLYGLGHFLSNSFATATFSVGTNGGYSIGSPNQVNISIINSNQPPTASTRIFFPSDSAIFASPLDIELRVASTNTPSFRLYADSNLLANVTTPPGNPSFVFSIVTNFSAGSHTVYTVGYPNVTSAPVHFFVLGTNAISWRTPSLGVMPTANSSFVIDANGAVFAWGDDRYGNLGDGGLTNIGAGVSVPIQIPLPERSFEIPDPLPAQRWKKVSAGAQHTLLLTTLGIPYVTGGNSFGQTGRGTNLTTVTRILLDPARFTRCKDIAAGGQHSLALTIEGQLYAWGFNAFGQLGLGNTTNASFPQLVPFPPGVTNWTAIAAGNNHSLALDGAGNLYAWGSGVDGILGTGGTTNSLRPLKVVLPAGVSFWTKISAGSTHNLALANDGKLYAWGAGFAGQLGIGYAADVNVPIPVLAPTNVSTWLEIAAGHEHSLGIADNGKLYLWGNPTAGASLPFVFLPTPVSNPDGVDSWSKASAGWGHSLALGDNCTLYSIGLNNYGQLGIGTFIQQTNLQTVKNLGDLCTGILVTATNHAPTFVKGPDITVPEDAGIQVFTNWATQINPGAPSETNQLLTFIVTNDNPHIFSTQPGITPSGDLFFAAWGNSNGVAHVTVVLKDNGGTANGGHDTSAPQTFLITVNAPPVPMVRVFPSFVLSSNYSAFQVISPNNSNALVYFDASLSTDVDGDPLTFAWFLDGTNALIGTGVVVTNTLEVGTNSMTLLVSDGHFTAGQPFEVQVLSASEAVGELIDVVNGVESRAGTKPNALKQLIDPLQSAQSEFDKELWNAGIVHVGIFQSRLPNQISDPAQVNGLNHTAQQIIDAVRGNSKQQPSLHSIENRSGNRKSLKFAGAPGQIYLVQASADLLHWETIGVANETDPGAFQFDDTASGNATARYYRLAVP